MCKPNGPKRIQQAWRLLSKPQTFHLPKIYVLLTQAKHFLQFNWVGCLSMIAHTTWEHICIFFLSAKQFWPRSYRHSQSCYGGAASRAWSRVRLACSTQCRPGLQPRPPAWARATRLCARGLDRQCTLLFGCRYLLCMECRSTALYRCNTICSYNSQYTKL